MYYRNKDFVDLPNDRLLCSSYFAHYSGTIPYSFACLLFSKLCWHNVSRPNDEHPITPADKKFSIICTSLALEAACKTHDDFKASIKKLVKMLQIGGYLALVLVEEETFYFIGENKWVVLPLSLSQEKAAVEEHTYQPSRF